MITLNDYLYDGNTIFRIIQNYKNDLLIHAKETGNEVDRLHAEFLEQVSEILEHNDFLTSQSRKILGFYDYLADTYPYLAFTVRGRIKSLIRAEEKFNGYIVEFIYSYYKEHGTFPTTEDLEEKINCLRDFIAYRIVISLPKCNLLPGEDKEIREKEILYEIANALPSYLTSVGLVPQDAKRELPGASSMLNADVRPYYRDYVENPTAVGYQSLHLIFLDEDAKAPAEIQIRTKTMDDYAEIGVANHDSYEKAQKRARRRRDLIPAGLSLYFDEAVERGNLLQRIDLPRVDVNMFTALDRNHINDGCGLYKGRLILPYEHLSRFQTKRET